MGWWAGLMCRVQTVHTSPGGRGLASWEAVGLQRTLCAASELSMWHSRATVAWSIASVIHRPKASAYRRDHNSLRLGSVLTHYSTLQQHQDCVRFRPTETTADMMLGICGLVLEGRSHEADLRDVVLVRQAIIRSADIYQPIALTQHIRNANLDVSSFAEWINAYGGIKDRGGSDAAAGSTLGQRWVNAGSTHTSCLPAVVACLPNPTVRRKQATTSFTLKPDRHSFHLLPPLAPC